MTCNIKINHSEGTKTSFIYHAMVFDKCGKFMFEINIRGRSLEDVKLFLQTRQIEYSYFEIFDIWREVK